ncbi:hypothetical protein P5673_012400 [Acropora cervicornis]|uniref:Uncharacterized protein n=1 Tax=Acropora cervicornis TaxID=6130 RepID=A0AAD9QNE1_ACRCE|nr:hypothetical protein P5673_012400 [Acropora cervicornis]
MIEWSQKSRPGKRIPRASSKSPKNFKVSIKCDVKGYQDCLFNVEKGDIFTAVKKIGDSKLLTPSEVNTGIFNERSFQCSGHKHPNLRGEPHDDPKVRWRIGEGINVPVKLRFQTHKSQAKEIKSSVKQKGMPVTVKPID